MRMLWLVTAVLLSMTWAEFETPSIGSEPGKGRPKKIVVAGLENVFRIHERLYSGSGPVDDIAFAALEQLGIKTIISVDGAQPDLKRARKTGFRYVHIPVGYNGVPRRKALEIAQAVRTLPGPFYIHCHHGKHRGPAAAAVAQLCLDPKCPVADALGFLKIAGTDPRYVGLYKSVAEFERPAAFELSKLLGHLPETVAPGKLGQSMVAIDNAWDHLKMARASDWKTPTEHPDIDPAHEALQLVEGFQELHRIPEFGKRAADFRKWAEDARANAQTIEHLLREAKAKKPIARNAVDHSFLQINRACLQCHAKYRDVP